MSDTPETAAAPRRSFSWPRHALWLLLIGLVGLWPFYLPILLGTAPFTRDWSYAVAIFVAMAFPISVPPMLLGLAGLVWWIVVAVGNLVRQSRA